MKARRIQAVTLEGVDLAALEVAIQAWFTAAGEAEFVALIRLSDLSVLILFTGG